MLKHSQGQSVVTNGLAVHTSAQINSTQGRLLDIHDLAALFKCSRETIKRLARSGELPAFKLFKHWYVRSEDLERFLADKVESSRHLRRLQEK